MAFNRLRFIRFAAAGLAALMLSDVPAIAQNENFFDMLFGRSPASGSGSGVCCWDRPAQVLPAWDATLPGYASVLAMYAFGLEEDGQYHRAEELAQYALAIDPRHPAIHVLAHVMEMGARPAWVSSSSRRRRRPGSRAPDFPCISLGTAR